MVGGEKEDPTKTDPTETSGSWIVRTHGTLPQLGSLLLPVRTACGRNLEYRETSEHPE